MKWLETILNAQGIEADQITSILADAKKQKLIPKDRFDEVNNSLKVANETISNINKELDTLKSSAQNSEILKQQIEDLKAKNQTTIDEYEGKIKGMKLHDYVKEEMLKDLKDPKYFELLYKEVDQSKLSIAEDGTVTGFDIKPFQEKYADLFGSSPSGPGSFGNPPRGKVGTGNESLGKRLASLSKPATEIKENPYF